MLEGSTINTHHRNDKRRRAILKQVNSLAWLLDNSIQLPGINYRIGVDALIGLIPGVGDLAGLLVSSVIVMQAMRLGVPRATLMRMLFNISLEAAIGVIPLIGDFFDATFKANARNVRLLNEVMGEIDAERTARRNADRGFIVLILGALIGIIALITAVSMAVFWWVVSLFR